MIICYLSEYLFLYFVSRLYNYEAFKTTELNSTLKFNHTNNLIEKNVGHAKIIHILIDRYTISEFFLTKILNYNFKLHIHVQRKGKNSKKFDKSISPSMIENLYSSTTDNYVSITLLFPYTTFPPPSHLYPKKFSNVLLPTSSSEILRDLEARSRG